tara:strand:- start:153 stop:494 length:342 start_codon:yes stop_codon:yes gene_type:complete
MLSYEQIYYGGNSMNVFTCDIDSNEGKINHKVFVDWDDKGNLHFCEHDLGDGVASFWGANEYEYFFMVHQKDVAKFILLCFWKGFTFEERFSVADLKELCEEHDIKYDTDSWF